MRYVVTFLIGALFGTAFGVAVGIFAFPFVFPPPPTSEEPRTERGNVVATGTFIHANPADPIHYGGGGVTVYPDTVYLQADFKVGPGPKYHVYLVPRAAIRSSADVDGTMFVDLGRLRAFEGSQNYAIPDGIDLSDYPSVVIWCEQFSVLISPADLNFAG